MVILWVSLQGLSQGRWEFLVLASSFVACVSSIVRKPYRVTTKGVLIRAPWGHQHLKTLSQWGAGAAQWERDRGGMVGRFRCTKASQLSVTANPGNAQQTQVCISYFSCCLDNNDLRREVFIGAHRLRIQSTLVEQLKLSIWECTEALRRSGRQQLGFSFLWEYCDSPREGYGAASLETASQAQTLDFWEELGLQLISLQSFSTETRSLRRPGIPDTPQSVLNYSETISWSAEGFPAPPPFPPASFKRDYSKQP